MTDLLRGDFSLIQHFGVQRGCTVVHSTAHAAVHLVHLIEPFAARRGVARRSRIWP